LFCCHILIFQVQAGSSRKGHCANGTITHPHTPLQEDDV
jgi:hypothetical protein